MEVKLGTTLCNGCVRTIIRHTIIECKNEKLPLDAGKLIPLLLEEQVIQPYQCKEVHAKACVVERTEKLKEILDSDNTTSKCLDVLEEAVISAGYEDFYLVLTNLMSNPPQCRDGICKRNTKDEVIKENIIAWELQESGMKAVIIRCNLKSKSEEEYDAILRQMNEMETELNESISENGEIISITKGSIVIVVKCKLTNSNYEDIALDILKKLQLRNESLKDPAGVQIYVTNFPKGLHFSHNSI